MSFTAIQSNLNTTNVQYLEKSSTVFDDFEKITTPIVNRINPLIDNYRSKLTTIRPVIAITGCSGVGKSYFSNQLLEHLRKIGINAKILHLDDFLDPNPFEGALESIHPHFDHRLAHKFLKKIWNGEEIIEKPAWNQGDQTGSEPFKIKEIYDLRGIELLIFEGEFTLCDEETYNFVQFSNVRVAIDAENTDLMRWDWERGRWWIREINSYEKFAELRTPSLSKYQTLLNPLIEKYADFIVRKDNNHHYVLSPIFH